MNRTTWRTGLAFTLVAGTVAHLLFSWIGFNPTDEGFILAASRRLLDGQVPHRDFISIRPAGPYLTFLPVVWLGGDYAIWLSRWVAWLQFAAASWWWVAALLALLPVALGPGARIALAWTVMAFSVHNFPIMAWHTLDALMFTGLGLALVTRRDGGAWLAGYAALGAAGLSRQNFALLVPGVLVLLGDWKRPACWLAAVFPVAAAAVVLGLLGALPDAVLQLGSKQNLLGVGFFRYLAADYLPWGLVIGYGGMALLAGPPRIKGPAGTNHLGPVLGTLAFLAVAGWASLELRYPDFALEQSFALFGVAVGALACLAAGLGRVSRTGLTGALVYAFALSLLADLTSPGAAAVIVAMLVAVGFVLRDRITDRRPSPVPRGRRRASAVAGALVILAAWSVSISYGYSSPALLAGPLIALLILWPLLLLPAGGEARVMRAILAILVVVLAGTTTVTFALTRCRNVYRDQAAWKLSRSLSGILPGGALIRTNPFTAAFLEDLNAAVASVTPLPVVIVPDCAAWWVKSPRPNPLPIDWPEGFTLSPPMLFDRVTAAMQTGNPRPVIVVQKVCAEWLPEGFIPLPTDVFHKMAPWVRDHFHKIGETRFFELYH